MSYLQQAVQKDPRFAAAHASLAFCYFPLAEFERVGWEEGIARVRALRGDPSGLRALLDRLNKRAQQRYVSPVDFARLHTALGEKDAAFARLEEAYRTKATRLHTLKTFWDFIPLRSDPRWDDLVHRLKLD